MFYEIALHLTKGLGGMGVRHILSYYGDAESVFNSKRSELEKIPGIGPKIAGSIQKKESFKLAEQEIAFIEKYKVQSLFFKDELYPQRLNHCADAPAMLFYKGNTDLNKQKIVSVVGTRNATSRGLKFCEDLIENLKKYDVLVVSGLAYGIDVAAHKAALQYQIPTIGVLGHGLDRIYPSVHRDIAENMISCGGLLTEFLSQSHLDRSNFPKRNRIIAGMSDAVIVIEATKTGGALITAEIANSYNRDVFAVPGRTTDEFSEGCNFLIKTNRAHLLSGADDLQYIMGWFSPVYETKNKQLEIVHDLNSEEQKIIDLIRQSGSIAIDDLQIGLNISQSKLAVALLNLEMKGVIVSLPGKVYRMN